MLDLPIDVRVAILSYLPLFSLASLASVSREWNTFFHQYESVVFRNAAILHQFVPYSSIVYSELAAVLSRSSLTGVNDWKTFCISQVRIERSWKGQDASRVTFHRCAGKHVHRIKVDEQRGFAIVSTQNGGINVVDLDEDALLWSLPPAYVRRYAHCEYDSGFLIFDRDGSGSNDVWRVAEQVDDDHPPPEFPSPPDEFQNAASQLAAELHSASGSTRGHFRPWALLHSPSHPRAFRFVYPTFIVAAECFLAFLWDVRSGELIQTIEDTENSPDGGGTDILRDVRYVEVTEGHALICSSRGIRVFSRATGRPLLDILSNKINYACNKYVFAAQQNLGRSDSVLQPQSFHHSITAHSTSEEPQLFDFFIAVHVSACGSHLVGLLMTSRLIVVPYFQRLFTEGVELGDIALDIQLGSPISRAKYLAFAHGRIGVATGTGIFIIDVDFESDTGPCLRGIQRIPWFNESLALAGVSCLQMSPTALFLNWDLLHLLDIVGLRRHYEKEALVPDEVSEAEFMASISDTPRHFTLDDGNLVVELFEPAGTPSSSSLFSIDFTPMLTGST
ncbi:hypothetical protein C8F01DRAFT_1374909 [Mycena amicta]|nr:hypothetical protein C8F01DRAFT_1374909 [Mycena amicta]